jgi:signal transduction histidine kinase
MIVKFHSLMRIGKPRKGSSTGGSLRRPRRSKASSDLIRANIIFSNTPPRVVSSALPRFSIHQFQPGDSIFEESTRGRHVYLILAGRVRIVKKTRSGLEPRLAVLHDGDFFGELSIIDGFPRSARAEAMESCTIAILPAADLRRLLHRSPEIAFNVLLNMAIRLRSVDQTFVAELERHSLSALAKMEQLRLLIDASKTVNSTLEINKLLDVILDSARRSIRADRGTLYLIDEARNELWAKTAQGENLAEIRFPVGKGLAGYVAQTGETINIRDAYKDPRFNPDIDKRSGYRTHTVLCMPMRDKEGKILGAFQFLNKKEGPFTGEDESFIAAFSVHASIALYNARLVQETIQSERLAAVGKMAAQIIHDIRNPMGSLRLYAETIRRRSKEEETVRISGEIMKQVDRFVKMAQEILDFSRGISELNLEAIGVDELLSSSVELFGREFERKNIRIIREEGYQGRCLVDIEKMLRAVYNIASNAADAMPSGGTFTIRTGRKDARLVFEFTDTGTGIPAEILPKILLPFFTHGKKLGTGLGLSIVKKIVDDHQGAIEIESMPDKGTTIRLFLPLAGA